MLALGCSNLLGAFFKIHVICCALSVTLAVDSAGGTSQVSISPVHGSVRHNSAVIVEAAISCCCSLIVCQSVCDAGCNGYHARIGSLPAIPPQGRCT